MDARGDLLRFGVRAVTLAWDVDAHEVLAAVAATAMVTLAFVLLRTRPDRSQNRWLAAALVAEALVTVGAWSPGLTDSVRLAHAGTHLFALALPVTVACYAGFLGTLETPVASVLRTRMGRTVPWLYVAVAYALLFAVPDRVLAPSPPTPFDRYSVGMGPLFSPLFQFPLLTLSVFGFIAAFSLWRRSPLGSARRARGAAFALAFGVRDGGHFVIVATSATAAAMHASDHVVPWVALQLGFPVVNLAFVALAGFGILSTQMFDIELRIKRGFEGTVVAGAIAVAFFVASELVEAALGVDGTFPGLVAAGAAALAMRPLHRLAERITGRLLPGVDRSDAYLSERRLLVYRAAVESALVDGVVTPRERAVLDTLREQLGIGSEQAEQAETEAAAAARAALSVLQGAAAAEASSSDGTS